MLDLMGEIPKCANCGATYTKTVHPWEDFVKCEYCRSPIKVDRIVPAPTATTPTVVAGGPSITITLPTRKSFSLAGFSDYLTTRKGVRGLDPVSGTLTMNNNTVTVDKNGLVYGENQLRVIVERWVAEYLSP